jgi:thiol:disulfide interchange protein DsbA
MNMKRRDFSKVATGLALVPGLAWAQAAKPVAGKDYQVLDPRAPVDAPAGKVEVVVFFSYMCPHCNLFEPTFAAWSKRAPKNVVIRRLPVAFLQDFEVLQRLYYTLEAMGMVDKLHTGVFSAIHSERRSFRDAAAAADWVAMQGVDRAKFMEQFASFSVVSKATRAGQLTSAYKIEGVPAIGVGGRFLTDGTNKGLLTVEALVADIQAGR